MTDKLKIKWGVIPISSTLYKCRVGEGVIELAKKGEIDESKIRIVHTMIDGTVRASVKGYEIPYNETTAIAYELIVKQIFREGWQE